MTDAPPIRDAARLISFGLQPGTRPTANLDYARLLERALSEPAFEHALHEIADGLGLRLLDLSSHGIALGAASDSPFAMNTQDYLEHLDGEQRVLHGLIHVSLAAFVFPRPEDLEDVSIKRVTISELDAFIREACKRLEQQAGAVADVAVDRPEMELAWRNYLRWPATGESQSGGRTRKTTHALIRQALDRLVDEGMLRAAPDGSWQVLHRYRLQVRELAAHSALQALRNTGA